VPTKSPVRDRDRRKEKKRRRKQKRKKRKKKKKKKAQETKRRRRGPSKVPFSDVSSQFQMPPDQPKVQSNKSTSHLRAAHSYLSSHADRDEESAKQGTSAEQKKSQIATRNKKARIGTS